MYIRLVISSTSVESSTIISATNIHESDSESHEISPPIQQNNATVISQPKNISIATLIGFSKTNIENELMNILKESMDNDIEIMSPISPEEVFSLGGNGVLLVYLNKFTLLTKEKLLNYIQAHIDSASAQVKAGSEIELPILLLYDANANNEQVEKFVNQINKTVHRLSKYITPRISAIKIEENSIEFRNSIQTSLKSQLPVEIVSYNAAKLNSKKVSSKQTEFLFHFYDPKHVKTSAVDVKNLDTEIVNTEAKATIKCSEIIENFMKSLRNQLTMRYPISTIKSSNKKMMFFDYQIEESNSTLFDDMFDIISSVATENFIQYSSEFESFKSTKAFQMGSIQLRLNIHNLLLSYYKFYIELNRVNIFDNFEIKLRKVSPTRSNFISSLSALVTLTVKSLEDIDTSTKKRKSIYIYC